MTHEGAIDLANVCKIDFQGVDIRRWRKTLEGYEIEVEDLVAEGEKVGNDVVAGFSGTAGYNDSFRHSLTVCISVPILLWTWVDFLAPSRISGLKPRRLDESARATISLTRSARASKYVVH